MDDTATTAVGVTTTDDGGTAEETTGGSPWMGQPLPDAEVGQWQWVDIEGTECINGNSTGLGVRYGTSENLAIYFEGGGACFNAVSCAAYYLSFANFDEGIFNAIIPTQLSNGVFDRENPDNPLRDWSFVYIPYCTGDVHAGERDLGNVEGFPGIQQFVGYRNFTLDLERIGPTFPNPEHLLVVGISAGGFGASVNYDRIADAYAYANVPVTLLDDSGPPFSDERAPACLQELWRELWRLDDTLPPACTGCFGEGGFLIDLAAPPSPTASACRTLPPLADRMPNFSSGATDSP